jgi:hypothetical protein
MLPASANSFEAFRSSSMRLPTGSERSEETRQTKILAPARSATRVALRARNRKT